MTFYLVLGFCGDYYCDEMHPVGLFSTKEKAQGVVEQHGFGFSVLPMDLDQEREWRRS